LLSGDGYLPGVETLGRSLVETGTSVPRVVMVTDDVPASARQTLASQGWVVRDIASIPNPVATSSQLYSRYQNVFTKLRAWELVEYDKVVFLDADTVVLKSIDDLFERPTIAAAPDFLLPDRFNSGVMVLSPSQKQLARMLPELGRRPSYDGGDQGFLNSFFDWYSLPVGHRLPTAYNTHHFIFQFLAAHPGLRQHVLDDVKIVHYTVQKPWRDTVFTGGAELWWRFYNRLHPEQNQGWRDRLHAIEDWSFEKLVTILRD
jgi:lipopolysaccharide biosynthesis glycosyltransferase